MTCNRLVKGVFVSVAVWGMFAATAGAAEEKAKEVVGTWKLTYNPGNGDHEATLIVTQEKSGLKGKFEDGDRKFDVTKIEYKGDKLTFTTRTERDGEKATATFEGKVKGDAIEGDASWEYQGMSGSFPFTGKREAEKPRADAPSAVAIQGKPILTLGSYDIESLGYQVEEFFVSGTASSYKLKGEATADGKWDAVPARTSPYTTRIVVLRPRAPEKFSGTVVVEWLNVSGDLDVAVEWNMIHREIVRRGHAYVAVSAQKGGIEGGRGRGTRPELAPLKKADPKRYERLSHPGDAYAYDIFSQAGKLVKNAAASKVLGPLVPRWMIAVGESQSAFFLTTYVNVVDPLARIYDGFLIHARFGPAPPLDDTPMLAAVGGRAKGVRLRPDLRVPVMTVLAESDVLGWPPLQGYHTARQPDTDRFRVWEIAGAAHADNYIVAAGYIDSGSLPLEKLAAALAPTRNALGSKLAEPMNFGPQQHYVVQAALWQLDRWLQKGQAPPKAPPLKLTEDKTPKLVTDAKGLAEGGLRTPWVDVPTARLTGAGSMVGVGKPFDAATLQRLYPGGRGEYLKKFEASLDTAIKTGFILSEDKAEILALAQLGYRSASEEKVADAASTVTAAKLKLMPRKSEERWFVPVGEYLTKAKDFDYVEEEWSATGVDHLGAAYTTQVFVRRPRDPAKFSGVVIVEPLHAASVAPIYMYCSPYLLRSGHGWACIASQKTALDQHVKPANTDRYNTLTIESGLGAGVTIARPTSRDAAALVEYMRKIRQVNIASNTILGQAGTALRSASGPFGKVNKMILAGHSQTGWVSSDYIVSAHAKARREDGSPVYDGFFPTGAPREAFGPRDVPLIQVVSDGDVFDTHSLLLQPENPGRHYRRPDSDDPNDRYRLYELAAVGHLGTRYPPHSDASFSGPRQGGLIHAKDKMNSLPHHELFNMALDHLIKWVTENVVPPRAPRIELAKGGRFFAKDQYGNSRGGVRCAQLDFPKATYHPVPLNAKGRPTFATVGTQVDFDFEKLKCLYGTPANYARLFNARLDELVYQGWLLSEDAKKLRADGNATSW